MDTSNPLMLPVYSGETGTKLTPSTVGACVAYKLNLPSRNKKISSGAYRFYLQV